MRSGGISWWSAKVRRFRTWFGAHVSDAERGALVAWTTAPQRQLFEGMAEADQRHGLDVVAALRAAGVSDPDVLVAGLLHDAAKGATGVLPRVAFSLGQAYGAWVWSIARLMPGYRAALDRLATHAGKSAELAASAGCSARTVELIRWQDAPRDPEFGELLRLADLAN